MSVEDEDEYDYEGGNFCVLASLSEVFKPVDLSDYVFFFFASSASSIFSGVIGSSIKSTPMAS